MDRPSRSRDEIRWEERRRIGRELHDGVAQVIALAKLQILRIRQVHNKPDPTSHGWIDEKLSSLVFELETALGALQRMILDLEMPGQVDVPLSEVLEAESERFRKLTGLEVEMHVQSVRLNEAHTESVLRIWREAFCNVARHAQATKVRASLAESEGGVTLTIWDNGIGIDPGRITAADSIGIRSMREQAHALGGTLEIRGSPSECTTVTVSFPLGPPAQSTVDPA
ncbi:sensor histidine kinase [Candidatus Nitrospira bockiana]